MAAVLVHSYHVERRMTGDSTLATQKNRVTAGLVVRSTWKQCPKNSISSMEKTGKLSRTKIHLNGVCVWCASVVNVYMFVGLNLVMNYYVILCDQRDAVHLFRTMNEFAHSISRLCCVFSQASPLPRVESTSLVQPHCNVASIFLLSILHNCFANGCAVFTVYLLLRQCTDDFSTAFKLSQANCTPRLLHSIDHTSPVGGWLVGLLCTCNSFQSVSGQVGTQIKSYPPSRPHPQSCLLSLSVLCLETRLSFSH